jgi:DNA-binding response OmpR family regulator
VHVKRLRAKIEPDRHHPTRIVTVRQVGDRFEPDPTDSRG